MRQRSETEIKDTWKLEDMVPSAEAWEQLYKEAAEEMKGYEAYQGKLAASADMLYEALAFEDRYSLKTEILYVYSRMKLDEDTRDQISQERFSRAQSLAFKAGEASSFLAPEILAIPEERLQAFRREDSRLAAYDRLFEILLAKRNHTLSPDMEMLLAQAQDSSQGGSQVFTMFNNADVKFPSITGADGQELPITHGSFISLLENPDRRIRRDAFQGLYSVYRQYSNTLAAAFASNVKQAAFYGKARHYNSSRQYYLAENEVPEQVYDNLIEAVRDHISLLHRYVSLRKRILGLEELHMYDLYVPLVGEVSRKYTFEEAKALVKKGLAPLGEDYLGLLEEGFRNRWIDVYENEGKRSGAYSWGAYGSHPYVLLNYQGNLHDVFTLAHEMGHALHSWHSDHSQPYIYAGYKIFVAEVASTCNEALLIRYLLHETEDKKEKAYLVNHFLESFRGTLFRQTMFAEFEAKAHAMEEAGEALTAGSLCSLYKGLNEAYFGPDMTIDEEIAFEWARIPHFYTPFYVYQYATGFSAAIAISSRILKGEPGALEGYMEFLKGGCSKKPVDLLKLAGVDMSAKKPVEEALEFFEELLEELWT